MPKHPYRSEAQRARDRAVAELESGDDARLRYAALELRTAIEALAYERVLMYEDELPRSELATWQPRKVFETLLEIDPNADQSSSLRFAEESGSGERSGPWHELGTERVISIKEIKKYYDKLGSYLHAPTVRQLADRLQTPPEQMRRRCEEIRDVIDEVLASPIHGVNFRVAATNECAECGKPIVCRMPADRADPRRVDCRETGCPASYVVASGPGDTVEWNPAQQSVPCGSTDCRHPIVVWNREIGSGKHWICPKCHGKNEFAIGVRFSATQNSETSNNSQR